jgi:Mn2+/Fe2+ NRAMP family transporter
MKKLLYIFRDSRIRILIFLSIFGPATITAMADNDANGVAMYAIAGAKLGYPILFILIWITVLLAITQEMGIRISLVTRKGFGSLIRERHGVRASVWIFLALFIANMGVITANVAAFKTTAELMNLPAAPLVIIMIVITFMFVIKGNYKSIQTIMLVSCVFYLAYIFSAFEVKPDWGQALGNLIYPHGVNFTPDYIKNYLIIGLGVVGTTITPWGQFFISSFGLDKNIGPEKLKYSQLETYWGAFLTNFFSLFMIIATAAALFTHNILLTDGNQAAIALEPFAGKLAASLFAFGIMNAGFMGIITVGLSTTYAFSEFFGFSSGLDSSYRESKSFYILFLVQLIAAFFIVLLPGIDLFKIVMTTQIINAIMLPPIFYFLISFTSNPAIMGKFVSTPFQRWFAIGGTVFIAIASVFTILATIFHL